MSLFCGCTKEKALEEALGKSYYNYLEGYKKGKKGSRSTAKLLTLHKFIAENVKEILENNLKAKFEAFYINGKEVNINGAFYTKRVDVFIGQISNFEVLKDGVKKIHLSIKNPNNLFVFSIKFITSNYKQNANNYFESLIGETVNLKSLGIKFGYLLFLKHPMPYLDRKGVIKKFEEIGEDDILKYYKVFHKRKEIFSPDFLFLGVYKISALMNTSNLEIIGTNIKQIAEKFNRITISRYIPKNTKNCYLISFLSQPFCRFLSETLQA